MAQSSENQLFHSVLCFIISTLQKKFWLRSSFICYNKHILMNSNPFQHNIIDFYRNSIRIWFQSLGLWHSSFFISVSDTVHFQKISSQLWTFIKILKFKCLKTVLQKSKASMITLVRYLTNGLKSENPGLTRKWDLLDIYLSSLFLSSEKN